MAEKCAILHPNETPLLIRTCSMTRVELLAIYPLARKPRYGRGGRRNRKSRREGTKAARFHFVTDAEVARYLRRGAP